MSDRPYKAEQRRGHYQQPSPFYRGSSNPHRGRGQFTGEGGGDDRGYPAYGRGTRLYNRGWVPRGKRRNETGGILPLLCFK